MNELQLLSWARSTGLQSAVIIFIVGMIWRLIEIYTINYKTNLAPARNVSCASGWHTILRRFLPPQGMFQTSPVTYIGGYVFHIGFIIIFFLFTPHVDLIEEITGLKWLTLPSPIIDLVTVITLVAMIAVLINRLKCPVKRFLSGFSEYLSWTVTFLPLLTGYLAAHHLMFSYTMILTLHILSVELLLIMIPFSNLLHIVTTLPSRWFNGNLNGQRGVSV